MQHESESVEQGTDKLPLPDNAHKLIDFSCFHSSNFAFLKNRVIEAMEMCNTQLLQCSLALSLFPDFAKTTCSTLFTKGKCMKTESFIFSKIAPSRFHSAERGKRNWIN
jgi:hypothetical protein